MGKKEKSKSRLDKFYYMAKEHGFRSRAAFKLIQLNKKYDFLSSAKCVVDLCAAPGGWLQVAAKYMPVASIKIGIDLDKIKPVKGCITYQADITTPRCVNLIKKELKHFKADIVMNDGAPNVGAEWAKDAYNQAELCLYALKVATEVLRKGGTFVTKVFRSKDYNSLLFVFNHFFNKVEATKPQASRTQSAEIFVVCQGYKAPDTIDPKFLDPKFAFADVDDEEESANKISSLKKLMDQKVNRKGYGERETLYAETDLLDFLESADPYQYLASYNKFKIDPSTLQTLQDKKISLPDDLNQIVEDLKVLGRRELFSLLKLRSKYTNVIEGEKKKQRALEQGKVPEKELNDEEKEAEVDKELEETIKRVEKERKRAAKKERERKAKVDMRLKMSVIANTDIHNGNDELLFDRRTLERLQQMDIENLEYENSEDDQLDAQENPKIQNKKTAKPEPEEDDDSEIDDNVKRVDKMAADMDDFFKSKMEYKMEKDKKLAKKEKKRKALLEQQRAKKDEASEEEALDNGDIRERRVKFTADPDESENDDDLLSDDDEGEDQLFVNPLLASKKPKKPKNDDDVSEGEWSDEDSETEAKDKKAIKNAREKTTLGKRKRREEKGDAVDATLFDNKEIEIVPQEKFEEGYSSMDSDDIAETRALAKLMLRKKARQEILDGTYNRFVTHDDKALLPQWFQDDEARHYKPAIPVTKEMIAEEKALLKAYNERPSKKVQEAKARKKKKLAKAMNKVKAKAQVIAEQEINEGSKMRQIQKLYKREKNKMKEEKSYVVNRNFRNVGAAKGGRNTKFVDARMKKETRAKKRIEKNKKSKGISKKRQGKGGKAKR